MSNSNQRHLLMNTIYDCMKVSSIITMNALPGYSVEEETYILKVYVGRGGCPSTKFGWTHLGLNGPIVLKKCV